MTVFVTYCLVNFPFTFMKAEYFLLIQLEMRLDCLFKL